MNIFQKVTWQNMRQNRTRTLVTIIGVVLSAAMITAIATFAVSLQNYMVQGAMEKYGSWQVGFLDVDEEFAAQRSQDEEVSNTTEIQNLGYASLSGGKNPDKPYLFVTGFDQEAFKELPIDVTVGRLPQTSEEILIPAHLAANGGINYEVGDSLTLAIGDRVKDNKILGQHVPYLLEDSKETLVPTIEKSYTIVGICQRPSFEEFSAPGYTLITTTTNQPTTHSVYVTLKNPRQAQNYGEENTGKQGYVLNEAVLRFMGASNDKLFNALLYAIGGILVILVMIGSIFLIYNSFVISLNERIQQFGILSSVGATPQQLRNSVLFEGLCIGAVGIPLGVLVGLGSIRLVIAVVAKNFSNILYNSVPLTLSISVPILILAVLVSLVTILLSAYIPARKAANTPVMESIRQTNEVKVEAKKVRTSKLMQRIYGLEGTLALKNFKRNKKRYRSIVLSLALSVILFVSAQAFGSHLKQAAESSVVDTDFDILFTTPDMPENELFQLYESFQQVDGVTYSSYQAILTFSTVVPVSSFSEAYRVQAGYNQLAEQETLPLDIQFIEDSDYRKFLTELELPVEEYLDNPSKMTAVAKVPSDNKTEKANQLINMFDAGEQNFSITPKVENTPEAVETQDVAVTFVDTIPLDTLPSQPGEDTPFVFMIVAPYKMKEQFFTPGIEQNLGLTFLSDNASQSVKEMKEIVQCSGTDAMYNLYNTQEMFDQNRNILFVVDVFTYVFAAMISLIAVANVFNTISTNIKLRRRELAMLRSVGMSDQDFNKMMIFECFFYGVQSLLVGVPTAAVSSWLIYQGIVMGGGEIAFQFPWSSLVMSVLSVFLIVIITMLYAVSKLKKENIIDALRDELT
ncbi:FtsX-like permease family protein [Enterococcus sp. AZ109]|uniref:ABC transporter permease n=1 Tax=Enterococcus sp. AZ109 TaxID=2774634 RepID=UPI003F226781